MTGVAALLRKQAAAPVESGLGGGSRIPVDQGLMDRGIVAPGRRRRRSSRKNCVRVSGCTRHPIFRLIQCDNWFLPYNNFILFGRRAITQRASQASVIMKRHPAALKHGNDCRKTSSITSGQRHTDGTFVWLVAPAFDEVELLSRATENGCAAKSKAGNRASVQFSQTG